MTKQELLNNPLVKEIVESYLDFYNNDDGLNAILWNQFVNEQQSQQPKQEWEILAFRRKPDKDTILVQYEAIVTLNKFGGYQCTNCSPGYIKTLKQCIDNPQEWEIYQVKHKGEVFTIGDKIQNGTIESFIKSPSEDKVFFNKRLGNSVYQGLTIEEIKEIKPEPLFITNGDNEPVFYKEGYYHIIQNEIKSCTANINPKSDSAIRFKSREKAEQYLIENAEVLSYKDVQSCFTFSKSESIDNLKELIKNKLGKTT